MLNEISLLPLAGMLMEESCIVIPKLKSFQPATLMPSISSKNKNKNCFSLLDNSISFEVSRGIATRTTDNLDRSFLIISLKVPNFSLPHLTKIVWLCKCDHRWSYMMIVSKFPQREASSLHFEARMAQIDWNIVFPDVLYSFR